MSEETPEFSSSLHSNITSRSLITFILVGGCATALHYLLTVIFVYVAHLTVVQGSAIGFSLSATANYLLNRSLTFKSQQAHGVTGPRFFITAIAGLLLNSLILWILLSARMHPVPAQAITTIGVLIWNYIVNSIWTFKKP